MDPTTNPTLDYAVLSERFRQQLLERASQSSALTQDIPVLNLNVRRSRILEDSFQQMQRKSSGQIRDGKLSIRFYNEGNADADEEWLVNEWFTTLVSEFFNADYWLFLPCRTTERSIYEPNPTSYVNPEHLSFFRFVGSVIGKAIIEGRTLDISLARSIYLHLLGRPVDYRDVEWVDTKLYADLCWILENDPTSRNFMFTAQDTQFGETIVVELISGGSTIPVTEDNKHEYVTLSTEYRLVSSIKAQLEALASGFYEIVAKDLISSYNVQELELLITGRIVG